MKYHIIALTISSHNQKSLYIPLPSHQSLVFIIMPIIKFLRLAATVASTKKLPARVTVTVTDNNVFRYGAGRVLCLFFQQLFLYQGVR